MKQYSMCLGR